MPRKRNSVLQGPWFFDRNITSLSMEELAIGCKEDHVPVPEQSTPEEVRYEQAHEIVEALRQNPLNRFLVGA